MSFTTAVDYLYSLGNEVASMKLGLENISILLAALGDPPKGYVKVQVAGTNGKGSVCAFLGAISRSAGIKTGVYTSPHLVSITERININGGDISDDDFARLANRVRETSERLLADGELQYLPTFFEQVTAIALLSFAEAGVELAILETGLGGRLDATTAAGAQIVAITQIDYDHQEYLGESLAEIAAEKAAIIRAGSRVVLAGQKREVREVLLARCSELGVEPIWTKKGRNTSGSECVQDGVPSRSARPGAPSLPVGFPPTDITLGLPGRHQIENARVAILLAELLTEHFAISDDDIIDGLTNAKHAGRLEYSGRYLFDGAHNAAGANALRDYLDEYVPRPITLVFAAMEDKDVREMFEVLLPAVTNLVLTQTPNKRSMPASELAAFVGGEFDPACVFVTKTVSEALAKARSVAGGSDDIILISGSLYLVGEAKGILNQEKLKS